MENNTQNEEANWKELERRVYEELERVSAEEKEKIWNEFMTLLMEALQKRLEEGSGPGREQ